MVVYMNNYLLKINNKKHLDKYVNLELIGLNVFWNVKEILNVH